MKLWESLLRLGSTTRFGARELSAYAEELMVDETRRGLMIMSGVCLALLLGSALGYRRLGLGDAYPYTAVALAVLCGHVAYSARLLRDLKALHVLGMALLIVSGTAFVLLAHKTGTLGAVLFISAALLFMVVPLVPWGLREASVVTLLIYSVFSSSTWTVARRFDAQTLWALQGFLLAAGLVSLTLVARSASVRRHDIESRFALEEARKQVERLSLEDPLTRAWNRRFLEAEFDAFVERVRKHERSLQVAICDIDRFKQLNDGFGHAVGDQVLRWVARAFATHLGDTGELVRAGGDEFLLLLDSDAPEELFETALSAIQAQALAEGPGGLPEISLSVGLVEVPPGARASLDDVYLAADAALYRAKRARSAASGPLHLTQVRLPAAERPREPRRT